MPWFAAWQPVLGRSVGGDVHSFPLKHSHLSIDLGKIQIRWYLPNTLLETMISSWIQSTRQPFWRWPPAFTCLVQLLSCSSWGLERLRAQDLIPKDRFLSQPWQPQGAQSWPVTLPLSLSFSTVNRDLSTFFTGLFICLFPPLRIKMGPVYMWRLKCPLNLSV